MTTSITSRSLNRKWQTRKCIIVKSTIALYNNNPSPTKYYEDTSLISYTQFQRNHQKATTIRSGTKIDTLISYYQYLKKPLSHCYTCLMQKPYMISNNFKCSSTIIDCTGTHLQPLLSFPQPLMHYV